MITYAKFVLSYGTYDSYSSDNYLEMVCSIFDDGSYWTECTKKALLDPQSPGLFGNLVEFDIIDDVVRISPTLVDDPEEYTIEIDRQVLLNLIEKWQELATKKVPTIYFIRYENGTIEVTDQLPVQ